MPDDQRDRAIDSRRRIGFGAGEVGQRYAQRLRRHYSANCNDSGASRLRVLADALTVEGDKRLTGNNVQAACSYFGQSPPPDYQVVLLGEVRGGLQLLFIVFRDKAGQYITLNGDPKV